MKKQTFSVSDMHCSNCAMKIESIEDELHCVVSVDASYVRGQVVVEYNEGLVTPEAIIAAVQNKGYTAVLQK